MLPSCCLPAGQGIPAEDTGVNMDAEGRNEAFRVGLAFYHRMFTNVLGSNNVGLKRVKADQTAWQTNMQVLAIKK
ncbi:hypothetical protein INT43_008354 [Umbelopsis isabellina]|uniref:Uncharacterized protein n=1 Tax=Mortierella isabellina TaxID=91625 RepID=A0A8H7PCY4_MORIS|nr:hypothetical protein INT43_008354 [Umbelopsis isabellina]